MGKTIHRIAVLFALGLVMAQAEEVGRTEPRGEARIWVDTLGGRSGVVVYPQYEWKAGKFDGGGFIFTSRNGEEHATATTQFVAFTPSSRARWFSVHTEVGRTEGGEKFAQIGPRLNVGQITAAKRVFTHLYVAALPHLAGERSGSVLLSAATHEKVIGAFKVSGETLHYFMPQHEDHAEYVFVLRHHQIKRLSFTMLVIEHGSRASLSFGARLSVKKQE
jgi:hypothetical protein